jgi:hypothetical protein
MTPEYIASRLSLLPQFEVVSIGRKTTGDGEVAILNGYFSIPVGDEEQRGNLFLDDVRFLETTVTASDDGDSYRTVEAGGYGWGDIRESEVVGANLAFFSSYDARRLRLVIDPDITWTKVDFRPKKAVQSRVIGTDRKPYRRLSMYREGMKVKEGESIVESAWDHEHCVFCLNRIDDEHIGYNSEGDGEWVCEWCYLNAVHPRDPRPLLTPYKSRDFSRQEQKARSL